MGTDMKQYFFTGTYTEPILFGTGEVFQGKGKGVYLCVLEDEKIQILSHIDCRNPSFLDIDQEKKIIYAVNEMKEYNGAFGGGFTQISYADGKLSAVQDMGTGGTDPCHVAIAPNKQFVSVANFANGSVTIFPLDMQGSLSDRQIFQHEGSGPHPIRQKGPHAHATIFLERENLMYVPDLGIDTVKAYRYEGSQVTPAPEYDFSVAPGGGPRSGVFSADYKIFYLIHEIGSQVSWYACDHGKMTLLGCVDTLPEDADRSANICSDLHITPDGQYLYASNRGHDSLCCYRIAADGSLSFLHRTSCGGKTPRNFAITPDGKYLLVGNQDSDTIAVFGVTQDGGLSFRRCVDFPTPVCIRFLRG